MSRFRILARNTAAAIAVSSVLAGPSIGTALTAAASANTATPITTNGPSLNGPSLNGPSLNGPSLNGPSLN